MRQSCVGVALLVVGVASALDGLHPRVVNPCLRDPFRAYAFCDGTLGVEERLDDLLQRLNLTEKIDALDTQQGPLESVGLNAYDWWSEASSGVASDAHGAQRAHPTTKFAFPITTAMSFNRTLWRVTGRAIATEGRALMNAGLVYSTFWAPVVNLARDPRWGRNIEVPGEDPLLTAEYATAFVGAFEGGGSSSLDDSESEDAASTLLASACCKHFAANELEATAEPDGEYHDRHEVDSKVDMRDLVDSYLPPFRACVEDARVSGLMCSYNAVNGVPSCANKWLLQDLARDEWGFTGYVTSDCDADADVFKSHHFTATPEEAVAAVLHAGTDVDCDRFVGDHASAALDSGLITEDDMDARLRNLFRVRFRLGHFDLAMDSTQTPRGGLDRLDASSLVCSEAHVSESMEGLAQSATLVKNVNSTLPLREADPPRGVAIVGPNAELSEATAGYYGPDDVCGGHFWQLKDAVRATRTTVVLGVPSVKSNDTSGIAAAVQAASEADAVLVAVGTDLSVAREGKDATSLKPTATQAALVRQVAAAARGKPVILIVFTATPLDLTDWLEDANVGAIVLVGQPSVTIRALGPLLYGERSFSGRLVQTVYPEAYADAISIFDFNMRPGPSTFARPDCATPEPSCPRGTNPGRTHRFYTGQAVLPFGFGLSYTTFSYNASKKVHPVSLDPVRRETTSSSKRQRRTLLTPTPVLLEETGAPLVVAVTNTGPMDADHVVLAFIAPPDAGRDGAPLQELFAFERIFLRAGETASVLLAPRLAHFTHVHATTGLSTPKPGLYKVSFGVKAAHPHGQGFLDDITLQAL